MWKKYTAQRIKKRNNNWTFTTKLRNFFPKKRWRQKERHWERRREMKLTSDNQRYEARNGSRSPMPKRCRLKQGKWKSFRERTFRKRNWIQITTRENSAEEGQIENERKTFFKNRFYSFKKLLKFETKINPWLWRGRAVVPAVIQY